MDDINDFLEDAGIEIEGEADVLSEAFIDADGDEVHEVGAHAKRRGSRGRSKYRRFRIPARVVRRASTAPITSAKKRAYAAPSEGGAMTPLSVGQANPGALTLTAEPQVEFQPLRMLVSAFDTATLANIGFRVTITDIKVGARTMLRAGGQPQGLPATMFSPEYTGANPAKYDAIRPGTRFEVTFAGLVATDVADCALVGRAG